MPKGDDQDALFMAPQNVERSAQLIASSLLGTIL